MKILNSLIMGTMLIASSAFADGFGFNLGPFDLQFGTGYSGYSNGGYSEEVYMPGRNPMLDNPICEAISSQQQLGMTVEGREVINAKEIKIVTKHLIVEPYAFGVTNDGKPMLRGKVVDEKLIKEVTVKFGDDRFEAPKKDKNMTGWFQSSDKKNIDIENISDLQIISNSHFEAPKDYKALKDDNVRVICQIPVKDDQAK